jgi:hypothetical protein
MRNTADVTDGKPIAVILQSISGVSAINPLVAIYDIHEGKRDVLFFYLIDKHTYLCTFLKYVRVHRNTQTKQTNVCTVRESNPRPLA